MPSSKVDVLILGAGPAGLSAGLWAKDLGLSAIVLEAGIEAGGQLLHTFNQIENHLGTSARNGMDLRDIFLRQLLKMRVEITFDSRVTAIDNAKNAVLLKNGTRLSYSYLLICTGVSRRTLGIPGEKRFSGKGILASGKRDAVRAKGKTALVVGGGDAAFENALLLAEHASKVLIVHRRREFTAREDFINRVEEHPLIEIVTDAELNSIEGTEFVEGVLVQEKGGDKIQIPVDCVVIRVGVMPNSEIAGNIVETDDSGYIVVNSDCSTSSPTIFAAGDVANRSSPTISSAVGMGATAIKRIREIFGS